MGTSHTWFATDKDLPHLLQWLVDAGAAAVDSTQSLSDFQADGSERVLYFPALGSVEYLSSPIKLSDYSENSHEWRSAALIKSRESDTGSRRMVNAVKTPAAGLQLPQWRDQNYWIAGSLWFPTPNLKNTYPDLFKICQRFERWIKKFPVVFDNRIGKKPTKYHSQICDSQVIQCIYAFSDAYRLLEEGAYMIDYLTSPKCTKECIERWQPASES